VRNNRIKSKNDVYSILFNKNNSNDNDNESINMKSYNKTLIVLLVVFVLLTFIVIISVILFNFAKIKQINNDKISMLWLAN
jgi:ATP-dependent Zn protease